MTFFPMANKALRFLGETSSIRSIPFWKELLSINFCFFLAFLTILLVRHRLEGAPYRAVLQFLDIAPAVLALSLTLSLIFISLQLRRTGQYRLGRGKIFTLGAILAAATAVYSFAFQLGISITSLLLTPPFFLFFSNAWRFLSDAYFNQITRSVEIMGSPSAILKLVLTITLTLLFVSLIWSFIETNFLGSEKSSILFPGDLFGDFFKPLFAYEPNRYFDFDSEQYLLIGDYFEITANCCTAQFEQGIPSIFLLTPLSSYIYLALGKILGALGIKIFLFFCVFLIFAFLGILYSSIGIRRHSGLIFLLLLTSYPFLFLMQRGHILSLIVFTSLVGAVLFLRRGKIGWALILFSIAVNVRPNLLIFLPIFYFWPTRSAFRLSLIVALSVYIFFRSYFAVNEILPDYTLENWLKDIDHFHNLYLIGPGGSGFNSSLFGLIKQWMLVVDPGLIGDLSIERYHNGTINHLLKEKLIKVSSVTVIFGIILAGLASALYFFQRRGFGATSLIFCLCSASMLGTPIHGDYYLVIFFLSIFMLLQEAEAAASEPSASQKSLVILLSSALVISSLNFLAFPGPTDGGNSNVFPLTFIKTIIALTVTCYLLTSGLFLDTRKLLRHRSNLFRNRAGDS